jgi:hypothetical protein
MAALLQRVEVPGTRLDTSRPDDWSAIEEHLLGRGMTVSQLNELIAGLQALHARSQFEQIALSFARYRHAEMSDINAVYHQAATSRGVWTMASLLVDGERLLLTAPARAGAEGADRVLHERPTEMTESEHDSEVATLATLTEFLGSADLSRWRNVNVIFSGSMGPCDGCKQRLQLFIEQVDRMARNAHARFHLILDVSYSTATNQSRQRLTTYGYQDDTEVMDLPGTNDQYSYWTRRFVRDCG